MPPLTPDRWRALSPYLDEALAMPAHNRAAWLADIRARDAALASDLESLLADHEELQESLFLEGALPRVPPSDDIPSLEGQIVGAYRLNSLIDDDVLAGSRRPPEAGSTAHGQTSRSMPETLVVSVPPASPRFALAYEIPH